jgi:hypothetical protein
MKYLEYIVSGILAFLAIGLLCIAFATQANAQVVPAQNQIIPSAYFGDGYLISTSTSPTHKLGASLIDLAGSFITGVLGVANGGTGVNTFTAGQLIYGNGTNALSSVATTSVSCSGSVSCSSFTAIGASPITITGSGGGGSLSPWATTTSTVVGNDIVYPLNSTDVVTIGSNATTSSEFWFDPNTGYGHISGRLSIGDGIPDSPLVVTNTGGTPIAPQTGTLGHFYTNGSNNARIVGDVYTNATAFGFAFQGRKSRGPSSSPAAPNADDTLVLLGGNGYGTTGFPTVSTGAYVIRAETSGFTDSSQPTYAAILTSPTGTITPTERLRVTSAGNVGIGTTSPFSLFSLAGNAYIGGNLTATGTVTFTNPLTVPNGGTGNSSYTAGNLLYADTTSTISGLTNVATGRVLISQGATAAPIWSETATLNTSVISPILTTNNNTSLANFRTVSATGIGTALNAATLQLAGSALVQFRTIFNGSGATVLTANTSYSGTIWGAQVATEATSGTHPLIANVSIKSPTITDGTAATTDLTSLYIEGAPTGITPTNTATALWVDTGIVRIDDTLGVGTTSPFAKLSVMNTAGGTTDLFAIGSSTAGLATSTALIVNEFGYVGIGTNNPTSALVVGGNQTGNAGFEVVPGSGIVFQSFNRTGGVYTSTSFDSLSFNFRLNGASNGMGMNILSTGQVGIGTTTPGTRFAIGSSTQYINLDNTATSTFAFGVQALSGYFTSFVRLGADIISDFTGFGMAIVSGALGLDTTGAADEECLTYESTGPGIEWQSCSGATTPIVRVATLFESSGRFATNNVGGSAGFSTSGLSADTTSTGGRRAHAYISDTFAGSNFKAYSNSPAFSCTMVPSTIGTTGYSFCGIGDGLSAGSITDTTNHTGFYISTAGGVNTVIATNANGSSQTKTNLTTISSGDVVNVYLKFNGTASIEFFYSVNGAAWSSATTHSTNIPTANEAIYISAGTANTTGQFVTRFPNASYER